MHLHMTCGSLVLRAAAESATSEENTESAVETLVDQAAALNAELAAHEADTSSPQTEAEAAAAEETLLVSTASAELQLELEDEDEATAAAASEKHVQYSTCQV